MYIWSIEAEVITNFFWQYPGYGRGKNLKNIHIFLEELKKMGESVEDDSCMAYFNQMTVYNKDSYFVFLQYKCSEIEVLWEISSCYKALFSQHFQHSL